MAREEVLLFILRHSHGVGGIATRPLINRWLTSQATGGSIRASININAEAGIAVLVRIIRLLDGHLMLEFFVRLRSQHRFFHDHSTEQVHEEQGNAGGQ